MLYSEDGYVDPPPGYWKVPYDLNKGAGGIFIYLATKTCSRQDPGLLMDGPNGLGTPITDLCVITGKSKDIQAPVGYTKVEGDLNQGTGGNFVYLCFHRGQLAEPIAELFTMGGKTSEVLSPPPGYAKIDADLNAGARSGLVSLSLSRLSSLVSLVSRLSLSLSLFLSVSLCLSPLCVRACARARVCVCVFAGTSDCQVSPLQVQ